jgi:hypothetical protein
MNFFQRFSHRGGFPSPPPNQMYPQQAGYVGYPPQQNYQQQINPFSTPPPMIHSRNMLVPPYLPTPSLQLQSPNSYNNMDHNGVIMHIDPKFRNMPSPNFQLSNCQGRKRALLIGINYIGTQTELRGNYIKHVCIDLTFLYRVY